MPKTKASLLIVDDEPSIRTLLSQIFTENGYGVRSAADGVSALNEIHQEAPEVLLSDLNMPGMSGFELLPMVRRRFPQIHLVAMSGAYSGNEVPSGVTADAFYQKGGGLGTLLKIMESLPRPKRMAQLPPAAPSPAWIARHQRNAAGAHYATIECQECLRTFHQILDDANEPISETNCVYCGTPIHFTVFRPELETFLLGFEHRHSSRASELQREGTPEL